MKRALVAALLPFLALTHAQARGVSPYLPLNLDPEMERLVERVLILADKPVLTRPIAAVTVLDALPVACRRDPVLCQQVRRYLARYMRDWSVTDVSLEASASGGSDKSLPNRYGLTSASDWNASARGFWQPFDHALVSLGAVSYQGDTVPEGSMLSVGFDSAQLDFGYRAHWLSPLTDSSMLIGTNAATMPSVTLSNSVPLTRWGFSYEAFIARMSESDSISFNGDLISGSPRLAGVHLSTEPAQGWALGVNRILQYGGGARPHSLGNLFRAFFSPSKYDNTSTNLTSDQQFGNQLASVTSTLIFPGKVPFSIYFEYAGEDTSHSQNYLLGNAALSAGIHFPRLWQHFDLTYEVSEWQNGWYVNSVYGDGLRNDGHVIGHWGGDERQLGKDIGAQTHMLKLGWDDPFGGVLQTQLRTIANEQYSGFRYQRGYDATVRYSFPVKGFRIGAEAFAGRDTFGESFSRFGLFARFDETAGRSAPALEDDGTPYPEDKSAELFVEGGASAYRLKIEPDENVFLSQNGSGAHFAVGARRAVSDRSDLGTRIELDDVNGHVLASVRAIDYRYRFASPLALSVFVGASRYDLATPAYGLYLGAGLQWRNVRPGWDVGLDAREAMKVARDYLLSSEQHPAVRPDIFYTINSISLSLTRRF